VAREAGLSAAERNPFRSIVVRAVEVLYAYEEAVRIIEQYETPERSAVDVPPRAGTGHGISEAPRGILYHRYTIDDEGTITDAVITPPTAQNQPTIEDDLRRFAGDHLHLSDAELQWRCEQAIRNYDPCISCSTHFLTLTVDRR
jgi:coenzyme F420-reducing hydrogenase alpha subunit